MPASLPRLPEMIADANELVALHFVNDACRDTVMPSLKLITLDTSIGVIIPEEMLTRLNVAKGDTLYATEMPDGGYRLTPFDPDFATRMEKTDAIMRRYRNALRALAK